jgi:hypothetical protein
MTEVLAQDIHIELTDTITPSYMHIIPYHMHHTTIFSLKYTIPIDILYTLDSASNYSAMGYSI